MTPWPLRRRTLRVAEFSELTGIPEQTARDRLRRGTLRGRKVGRTWRVFASEARREAKRGR